MIHPTAIVHEGARLAPDVSVGPYSIIGEHVEIDAGTTVGPHVVINGHTRIGKDNRVFQFSSLGEMPQDKKYQGEETRLEIGDRNVFREYCTVHRGTEPESATVIGDDCYLMGLSHVGHNCAPQGRFACAQIGLRTTADVSRLVRHRI